MYHRTKRFNAYVCTRIHPPSPSKFTPFCSGGLAHPRTFCILLLGRFLFREQIRVIIEFRSSQLRPSQMWETYKQMIETDKPCVPFDVFLFDHWEWCEKVDHVRHRGLKRMCRRAIFSPSIFCRSHSALQTPCSAARNLQERHASTPHIDTTLHHSHSLLLMSPWPPRNMQSCRAHQTMSPFRRSLLGCCGQFYRSLGRVLLHIYRWKHQ